MEDNVTEARAPSLHDETSLMPLINQDTDDVQDEQHAILHDTTGLNISRDAEQVGDQSAQIAQLTLQLANTEEALRQAIMRENDAELSWMTTEEGDRQLVLALDGTVILRTRGQPETAMENAQDTTNPPETERDDDSVEISSVTSSEDDDEDDGYVNESNDCHICAEKDLERRIILNCGHTFCTGCLNDCFRVGLSTKASFPPRCCTGEGIDIVSAWNWLSDENIIQWTLVAEEYSTRIPTFCCNKICSQFFDANKMGTTNDKFVTCNECETETCTECKQNRTAHTDDGTCPEIISKEDKDLADGEKWKQCPGCKNLVEKKNGCDHMICECGTEFCYGCGEEYAQNNSCGCRTVPDEDGWHERLEQEELQANQQMDNGN